MIEVPSEPAADRAENGACCRAPMIEQHRCAIRSLTAQHGIRDGRVFGCMARLGADDTSDVDLSASLDGE